MKIITLYKILRALAYIIAAILLCIAAFKNCSCYDKEKISNMNLKVIAESDPE